jgi:nicotinamide mononucleotide transporter
MSWQLEALAALLLLANVWLVAQRSMWNWAFGIAAVSLYAFVFWQSHLYAAFGLQLIFLGLNLYGLLSWGRTKQDTGDVGVVAMSGRERIETAIAVCAIALPIGWLLSHTTDAAMPWWDSANTALALAAQYWQARRRVENWVLWILVNFSSVGLYATQALWFTSATYALLFAIALFGLREWRRALGRSG